MLATRAFARAATAVQTRAVPSALAAAPLPSPRALHLAAPVAHAGALRPAARSLAPPPPPPPFVPAAAAADANESARLMAQARVHAEEEAHRQANGRLDAAALAAAAGITGLVGVALWWGVQQQSQDNKKTPRDDLISDLTRQLTSALGVEEAECAASQFDLPRSLPPTPPPAPTSAAPVAAAAAAAPVSLADADLVSPSYLRRFAAFFIDNLLLNGVMFALQYLVARLRPDWDCTQPAPLALANFGLSVAFESTQLKLTNGKTLGKWVMGTRVVREDREQMNWKSAVVLAGVRGLCTAMFGLPLVFTLGSGESRDCGRLAHNWASDTLTVMDNFAPPAKDDTKRE